MILRNSSGAADALLSKQKVGQIHSDGIAISRHRRTAFNRRTEELTQMRAPHVSRLFRLGETLEVERNFCQ